VIVAHCHSKYTCSRYSVGIILQ